MAMQKHSGKVTSYTATATGGGIQFQDGGGLVPVVPLVSDSVISGNSAVLAGGGVDCTGISPTLAGCVISGNSVVDLGGGVEIVDSEDKVRAALPQLEALLVQADSGGLMTLENAEIIRYTHGAGGEER